MTTRCPIIVPTLVIADDARLAAQISCLFASPGAYLPVMEGPKLRDSELARDVVRRNDAAARAKPGVILLAGVSDASYEAISSHFAPVLKARLERVKNLSDVDRLHRQDLHHQDLLFKRPPLQWGRDRIGIGLLKALRGRSRIVFSDNSSPTDNVSLTSDHVVICEENDGLSQVIAANYAFALGAGLHLIPGIDGATSERILDDFDALYVQQQTSRVQALKDLRALLRERCGPFPVAPSGSVTFVTRGLPYGLAFPEFRSTHLLSGPGIGMAVINGFAAEQPKTHGVSVAALVDPGNATAAEIAAAKTLLSSQLFLRSHEGSGASVRAVAEMIELFPYDLLIIPTHCGDVSGYRQTYEFGDSEGTARKLVVDVAMGFARTNQKDMSSVRQFVNFVALDGVDWRTLKKAGKPDLDRVMLDFMARTRAGSVNQLEPVKSEVIPHVAGSTALKMYDHNYVPLPRPMADRGTPIVINNACGSWRRLVDNDTFGDARAYIGTLFPVAADEAQEVVVKLLGKYFGQPLAGALWLAQREVYGDDLPRPYIIVGVYPQRLRASQHDIPKYIASRLTRALGRWKIALKNLGSGDEKTSQAYQDVIQFYKHEIAAIKRRWLDSASGFSGKQ
jgi:hypothetical protein